MHLRNILRGRAENDGKIRCCTMYFVIQYQEQDREKELVNSIEKYLIKILADVEWSNETERIQLYGLRNHDRIC